jgi:hypothetical protein
MFTEEWEQRDNFGWVKRLAMVADEATCLDRVGGLAVRFADKVASVGIDIDGIGKHGVQSSVKCVVGVPRISRELLSWLALNAERRWVVYVEDYNNLVYRLGNVGDGCKLTVAGNIANQNGYEMAWTWSGGLVPGAEDRTFNDIVMGVGAIDLRKYNVKNVYVMKGDSFSVDFEFEVAGGILEDLTGNTFSCVISTGVGTLATLAIGTGFTLSNNNTKLVMSRTAAQTAGWAVGEYSYTIKRTWPDGSVDTIFKGKWVVE